LAAAVRVAETMRRSLRPAGITLAHTTGNAAWQSVFHFHLNLVPPLAARPTEGGDATLRAVADANPVGR
jgi:diadenosine tetraphosphate (Ap4A) HIT family hydrolase